jgi:hypothetical protein
MIIKGSTPSLAMDMRSLGVGTEGILQPAQEGAK